MSISFSFSFFGGEQHQRVALFGLSFMNLHMSTPKASA